MRFFFQRLLFDLAFSIVQPCLMVWWVFRSRDTWLTPPKRGCQRHGALGLGAMSWCLFVGFFLEDVHGMNAEHDEHGYQKPSKTIKNHQKTSKTIKNHQSIWTQLRLHVSWSLLTVTLSIRTVWAAEFVFCGDARSWAMIRTAIWI